ncbi:MAG: phosphate propanoyltransferase [Limnochordia bacterium]|jgi:putative phosphotransacetylase|nr:phosphate propanoyltransferase [Limnochordia bacterium]
MDERQLVQEITRRVLSIVQTNGKSIEPKVDTIPVGVSVRHVHICQADLEKLYGPGASLHKLRDLYQPGEFAAEETVTLIGPRMRSIENVRILGPMRVRTQVEVSRTDAITLGLNPPVRPSGNLAGSAAITLVGPAGSITLKESCILANRHIHMTSIEAALFGVEDDDLVEVEVAGEKALVFRRVQVRVKDTFKLQMHLDTDDANAAGINCGAQCRIIGPDSGR